LNNKDKLNINNKLKEKSTILTTENAITAITKLKSKTKINSKASNTANSAKLLKQSDNVTTPKKTVIDYLNVKVTNCDKQTNCPILHAICTTTSNCMCRKGFANVPSLSKETCSYVQKSQKTAFFLEIFLNFGVGHFYIGLWWLGLIKLLIIVIIPIMFLVLNCIYQLEFMKENGWIMEIVYYSYVLVWLIIDIALYATNTYHDGNGIPLAKW